MSLNANISCRGTMTEEQGTAHPAASMPPTPPSPEGEYDPIEASRVWKWIERLQIWAVIIMTVAVLHYARHSETLALLVYSVLSLVFHGVVVLRASRPMPWLVSLIVRGSFILIILDVLSLAFMTYLASRGLIGNTYDMGFYGFSVVLVPVLVIPHMIICRVTHQITNRQCTRLIPYS